MEKYKKHFVPWFNSAEWHHVYNLIYGENSSNVTRQEALDILKIWKIRSQHLQSGAEGTLIILGALLIEPNLDDYNKRMIFSTSIMRFLNICAAYDKHQGSFYKTAKKRKIPEWIINLRHDIAHSQNLPNLDILKSALTFCLDWVNTNYWSLVSKTLNDYIVTKNEQIFDSDELKSKLEPYLVNYLYLSIAKTDRFGYNAIADISDSQVRNLIEKELTALLNSENIQKSTKINHILHLLWHKIERCMFTKNGKLNSTMVAEILIENELFLGLSEEIQDIEDSELIFAYEKLLRNLHCSNMIEGLLEKLLEVVFDSRESVKLKKKAAFWLCELGKAFSKCLLAQNLYEDLQQDVKNKITANQLNIKLKYDCEKENPTFKNVLTLDLMQNIPELFTNVEVFKEKVLREPNEYTQFFMHIFLEICEDLKTQDVKEKILKLNDSFNNISQEGSFEDKIYTIDDLAKVNDSMNNLTNGNTENEETMDCSENESNIWSKVTDIDFQNCPIGILPWQTSSTNPLLHT